MPQKVLLINVIRCLDVFYFEPRILFFLFLKKKKKDKVHHSKMQSYSFYIKLKINALYIDKAIPLYIKIISIKNFPKTQISNTETYIC